MSNATYQQLIHVTIDECRLKEGNGRGDECEGRIQAEGCIPGGQAAQ